MFAYKNVVHCCLNNNQLNNKILNHCMLYLIIGLLLSINTNVYASFNFTKKIKQLISLRNSTSVTKLAFPHQVAFLYTKNESYCNFGIIFFKAFRHVF